MQTRFDKKGYKLLSHKFEMFLIEPRVSNLNAWVNNEYEAISQPNFRASTVSVASNFPSRTCANRK